MSESFEPTRTPRNRLHVLLLELFSAEEFRRWLTLGPDADIIADLPGELAGTAEVVHRAVGVLERQGRIDAAFFARMTTARPRRGEAIAAVAVLWNEPALTTGPVVARSPEPGGVEDQTSRPLPTQGLPPAVDARAATAGGWTAPHVRSLASIALLVGLVGLVGLGGYQRWGHTHDAEAEPTTTEPTKLEPAPEPKEREAEPEPKRTESSPESTKSPVPPAEAPALSMTVKGFAAGTLPRFCHRQRYELELVARRVLYVVFVNLFDGKWQILPTAHDADIAPNVPTHRQHKTLTNSKYREAVQESLVALAFDNPEARREYRSRFSQAPRTGAGVPTPSTIGMRATPWEEARFDYEIDPSCR